MVESGSDQGATPQAIVTMYRGEVYDSKLEAAWAATLDAWSIGYTHHPGSIALSDGRRYEPDFLLRGPGGEELLAEVKGPGGERLDKPRLAARESGLGVVCLRPGLVPPGSDLEEAGAVWHDAGFGAWVVVFDAEGRGSFRREPTGREGETVRWSAEQTWVRPECEGLAMVSSLVGLGAA